MLTHISNNFLGSTVHSSLANSLAEKGVASQFVYCPLQKKFKKNLAVKTHGSIILSSPRVLNRLIRYFPLLKVFYSFIFFLWIIHKNKVKPSFIIAHNLWSDGLIAWFYYKLTGTPFTVALRNTDINHFIPKLPHYRWLIRKVVSSSEQVVFINQVYARRLKVEYISICREISEYSVIYNGIDEEWFKFNNFSDCKDRKEKVCYVGSFLKNKNLKNSVLALKKLRSNGIKVTYVAIGGSIEDFLKVTGLSSIPDWIEIVPRTNNLAIICDKLRESRVFLMPSFKETFGLVYIEALSQGCCIVHTRKEGIEGVFDEPFIKSVDPCSVDEIASKIELLLASYPKGVSGKDVDRLIEMFSWGKIADQYLEIIKGKGIENVR